MVYEFASRPGNDAKIVKPNEMIHPKALTKLERAKGKTISFEIISPAGLGIHARGVSRTYNGKLVGIEEDRLVVDMYGSQIRKLAGYANGDLTIIRHFFYLFGDCDVVNFVSTEKRIFDRSRDITTREKLLEERKRRETNEELISLSRAV